MSVAPKLQRLESILETDFAKSLGEPTDFSGHDRLMFSLDNADSSIVNERTLPKIVDLIQDIVGSKLDLRICRGAYRYHDGTYVSEVSFLVRYDSYDLYRGITEYLKKNTRQESVLIVHKSDAAALYSLHGTKRTAEGYPVQKNSLGYWKKTTEAIALKSPGYTQIGDLWFVCHPRIR